MLNATKTLFLLTYRFVTSVRTHQSRKERDSISVVLRADLRTHDGAQPDPRTTVAAPAVRKHESPRSNWMNCSYLQQPEVLLSEDGSLKTDELPEPTNLAMEHKFSP